MRSERTADDLKQRLYRQCRRPWTIIINAAGPREGSYHDRVGGQLCIIRDAVRRRLGRVYKDPTEYGVTMALEIDYQKSQLLVVNTYWPVAHETKSGLHTKLAK